MRAIRIPRQLTDAVGGDAHPDRCGWLAALPGRIDEIASGWGLELGDPYPSGQCAWVAPARNRAGDVLVLKVGWRHREAEHEADALRVWDGDGAVRCLAACSGRDTIALLLERCSPGTQLRCSLPEPEQDVVLAALLWRLWERPPPAGHPFASLQEMCDLWAASFERELATDARGLDLGLARAGIEALRGLSATAMRSVLLCTDPRAGNVLCARREEWLVIDPKPLVEDPAYDAVQHMLNCDQRLADDPCGLATRMRGCSASTLSASKRGCSHAVCRSRLTT